MDTRLHTSMFTNFCKSYDDRNFPINKTIKSIMFHNLSYLEELDASGKARPAVLENVQRMLLCRTVYLGYDLFECPHCGNENLVCRSCHSRFCNACGIKYAKQLAVKAVTNCLDVPHRHIVFTIPQELRNWFQQDRSRMNLLFVAGRNTISSLVNSSLSKKNKKLGKKNTYYAFSNFKNAKHFGMIATLHTFGRDLKWNPHIHCLVPEMIYDPITDKLKKFHHFDFKKLRLSYQYELLRLIETSIGSSFKPAKRILYNDHKNGFYVYAKYMKADEDDVDINNTENINACITYCMRYASRPAMAESRITEYNHDQNYVRWFYTDHKTDEVVNVFEDVNSFINKLIVHIPDKHFRCVRYFGFYGNASKKELHHLHELLGHEKHIKNVNEYRKEKRLHLMEKLKYRTHMIDSFNRDPLKCSCGNIMVWIYTYNPLEGKSNERNYREECINEMRALQLPRGSSRVGDGRARRVLT